MTADKKITEEKDDKKKVNGKNSADAVETPTPPQHMDPSKKPLKENKRPRKKRITR